jgi:hypothetical protein
MPLLLRGDKARAALLKSRSFSLSRSLGDDTGALVVGRGGPVPVGESVGTWTRCLDDEREREVKYRGIKD